MSRNNGYERKQFDEEQEKQAEEYRKAGMSEEAIAAMHEFDEEAFHSRRAWEEHKQDIATTKSNGEDTEYEQSIVQRFFDRFTTAYDTYGTHWRSIMFEITYKENAITDPTFTDEGASYDFTFENRYDIFHRPRKDKLEYVVLDTATDLTSTVMCRVTIDVRLEWH